MGRLEQSLRKLASKLMPFPEDEVESLKGRNSIITHRVSKERGKYDKGDVVSTPWGDKYVVSDRSDLKSVDDSPYAGFLTPEQRKALLKKKIALLVLRRLEKKASVKKLDSTKWPEYDEYQKKHHDETIDRIDELMRKHFEHRRPWGVRLRGGGFVDNDSLKRYNIEKLKGILRRGIVRTGDHAVKANRGICHDLASARLKMLSDMGVPARRVFIDYEGSTDPEHYLGHSMVFFKDKDGHYHRANRHMRDANQLGDFDSLEDAVRQHIADVMVSGDLEDDQPVSVYDNTDIEFPDEVPLKDYMRMSWEHGKRLYEQGHRKKASARKETYESGEGEVESYTPGKTKDHDEIVLRTKDGRRVVISNNTRLGKVLKPRKGDSVGYHGYGIKGTNVVHKVHPNKSQRGGWLEREMKKQAFSTEKHLLKLYRSGRINKKKLLTLWTKAVKHHATDAGSKFEKESPGGLIEALYRGVKKAREDLEREKIFDTFDEKIKNNLRLAGLAPTKTPISKIESGTDSFTILKEFLRGKTNKKAYKFLLKNQDRSDILHALDPKRFKSSLQHRRSVETERKRLSRELNKRVRRTRTAEMPQPVRETSFILDRNRLASIGDTTPTRIDRVNLAAALGIPESKLPFHNESVAKEISRKIRTAKKVPLSEIMSGDNIYSGGMTPEKIMANLSKPEGHGRTWWSHNGNVALGYALKERGNFSNRGKMRRFTENNFTPHIATPNEMEIMLANLSAKRGDKTGTFNGKRSSKAYDYEVVLPMELLRRMAQGKNIKSYTIVGNKDRIKKLISGARGDLKISHGHSRMPKDIMAVKSVNPHENVVINGPSLKHV